VGFAINTLDGKEALLAHIKVSGQYRVGRYRVLLESIESVAVQSMIPKTQKESVVVLYLSLRFPDLWNWNHQLK